MKAGRIGKFALVGALALGICSLCACAANTSETDASGDDIISVISREDGSGTRSAFIELLGIENKDSSGQSVDATTPDAVITNSTSVMMTTVAGDPLAIGYISLGSLNDNVKAVEVDGVAATAANVKDGSYTVSRPFNIVTNGTENDVVRDFISFVLSNQGQAIVEQEGYIAVDEGAGNYEPSELSGTVVVAGSSSVTPVMEVLAEAYEGLNGGVDIQVNQSDSTTGINSIIDGTADIGMASRELKNSEIDKGLIGTVIAQDGIAIIVNLDNPVENLSTAQIREIYMGEITYWGDID